MIKWPGSVHDSRNFFWILLSIKCFEKGQFHSLNHHPILWSFPIWWFCTSFVSIYHEFPGGENIQDQSSSAINGLVHVSQLRIHLVYWKPVLDAHNVLWILIYPCSSFISSLSITLILWVTEGKNSRTEPSVSPENRVQPATSNLSLKGFLNEKKATDIR